MGTRADREKDFQVRRHITPKEAWGMVALGVLALIALGLDLGDQPIYEKWKPYGLVTGGALLLSLMAPAALRCAAHGFGSVWSVVKYSVLMLLIFLAVFYTTYYWVADPSAAAAAGNDKLLNFPPMIAAVWAACVGWYITFQAAAKNHRTTNSFNLIMQTRTSKEFLDRAKVVQTTYPHGSSVPDTDHPVFGSTVLRDVELERQRLIDEAAQVPADLEKKIRKAAAIDSLKYLLNYYEFMAVGIEKKDLEEDLVYETIGFTVVSIYNRSKAFIDYTRDPERGNQPLAFVKLQVLAVKWGEWIKQGVS